MSEITTAAGRLSDAPLCIDDTAAITVLEMKAKLRRLKADAGLGLIVVDYIQLMRYGNNRDSERTGNIGNQPFLKGTVKLAFVDKYTSFQNLSRVESPEG